MVIYRGARGARRVTGSTIIARVWQEQNAKDAMDAKGAKGAKDWKETPLMSSRGA